MDRAGQEDTARHTTRQMPRRTIEGAGNGSLAEVWVVVMVLPGLPRFSIGLP